MAATEFVDVALIRVRRADDSLVDLQHPSSLKITRSKDNKPVKTMNRSRNPLGYKVGSNEYTWELETPIPKDQLEIDWYAMWSNDEVFDMIRELGDGGRRRTANDCKIDEIEEDYNEDGEAVLRITGKALSDLED